MKNERLLYVLGLVDEQLVESAAPDSPKVKRAFPRKWLALAACLVLVVLAGVGLWQRDVFAPAPAQGSEDRLWPVKTDTRPTSQREMAIVPKWDEQTVSQQFSEVAYQGVRYVSRVIAVGAESVGEVCDRATLSGYDIYTDTAYIAEAAIYEIRGISAACAVALQFEGGSDYYVYVNFHYKPATLGDLIEDLRLEETMTFGSAWYRDTREDGKPTVIEFVEPEDTVVWQMLLADRSLQRVESADTQMFIPCMSVSVNIPLLGYENISLAVTEDGYLTTNILDTRKVFDIGAEKVEQFVDYVMKNCQGYELIQEPNDNQMIPE